MSQPADTGSADQDRQERHPVDLLADEFASRLRVGETPSVDEYVQRHPGLAAEIRAVFPTIARIEKASRQQLSGDPSAWSREGRVPRQPTPPPERIGDFQIIRQLGEGGMGIVYEALQTSLHRHVALKVISPLISQSPKQLARFEREAATAARLHHTNIVPVFGSGEENGVHYYAMQLIEGVPLHVAVKQLKKSGTFDFVSTASDFLNHDPASGPALPDHHSIESSGQSPRSIDGDVPSSTNQGTAEIQLAGTVTSSSWSGDWRFPGSVGSDGKRKASYQKTVCQCVADIADALQYAHEQGVLHRDIKPSNLLLDRQGTVWITDFGLAKFDGHDEITRTGDMVGTLRYMAPEQFSGEGDARSDICSLGLTLYELLILQPAYSETRSARLMKLKTEQAPPAPSHFDPAIPRDLDTIVVKACTLSPEHRYQTAGEFRDDLIRFIEGRPILARRTGTLEQCWRWSRRNPLIASLTVISLALLVTVAVVSILANQATRAALRDKDLEFRRAETSKIAAQQALQVANAQKRLADANFSVAIRAFEEIMANISRRGIPHGIAIEVEQEEVRSFETSLTQSDVEVLETLLGFFAEFATQNKADLSFQSALALQRVAEIQKSLGRLSEAEETFEQAMANFRDLDTDKISPAENHLVQMKMLNEMSYCANRRGDLDQAEEYLRRAAAIFHSNPQKTPELLLEYARSRNIFTSMYTRVGYVIHRQAIPSRPPRDVRGRSSNSWLFGRPPNRARPERPRFKVSTDRLDARKRKEIREANEQALEILSELIESDADHSSYQLELSRAFQDRVRLNRRTRTAREAFEKAKSILEDLVDKHPGNPAYRFELADLLCHLEKSGAGDSNPYAATRVARELVDSWPNVSEYQALYADAQARTAMQRSPEKPGNRRRLEASVDIYRELVSRYPDYFAYKINFSQYLIFLGSQYAASDQPDRAEPFFLEAEACLESLQADGGNDSIIGTVTAELTKARARTALNQQSPPGQATQSLD